MLRAGLVPGTFEGLPTHALIVHFTVVALPLTTLALLLCAFSGTIRARVGIVLPLAGIASLILVPLSTSTGRTSRRTSISPVLSETRSCATSGPRISCCRGRSGSR